MSSAVALLRSRQAPQFAALALISVVFAGCSADTARFNENPFATAQAPQAQPAPAPMAAAAPSGRIESAPLPQTYSSAPTQQYPQHASLSSSPPVAGGGRGVGSYQPSAPIETTASISTPRSAAAASGGYTNEGGTRIIVGTSDTLDILARRYNVPAAEIMKANRMSGPRQLQPGQSLTIPRRIAGAPAAAPAPAPVASAPATRPASGGQSYTVANGDTLMKLSRKYNVSLSQLARANGLTTTSMLKPGSRLTIPTTRVAAAAPAAAPAPAPVAAAKPAAPAAQQVASVAPAQKANLAQSAPAADPAPAAEASTPAKADATASLPSFRWPVRGRVIAGYGAKTNGKQNDGINVAVPEGTPIKAADDGVVAYAGNELKGYGNLVLVRHASGYVSAYAHASEISVKRGDTVKRGQVVGKAGQTGDVTSPQLHFEIRKGSAPVDPLQFLNGV